MKPLRMLLASPRFWPLAGPRELFAASLARDLARNGHHVTVVTRRWMKTWPEKFRMGPVNVIRLPRRDDRLLDPLRRLGRGPRWADELSHWLSRHRSSFDLGYVIAEDVDSDSIARCLVRAGLPAVVNCETDLSAEPTNGYGMIPVNGTRVRHMNLLHETSGNNDISGSLDSRLADWRPPDRAEARAGLACAHPILELPERAVLAICSAPLVDSSKIFRLATAWRRLLEACPSARLWMIGEGRQGRRVFQHVLDLEIDHAMVFPGNFDEIRDVLRAANGFIMPGPTTLPDWYWKVANDLGVPVICHADNPAAGRSSSRIVRFEDEGRRSLERVLIEWARQGRNLMDETNTGCRR